MSEGERIESLKTKHAELDSELHTEENKLQPDPLTVAAIKKRKLQLKDEMARIEAHA